MEKGLIGLTLVAFIFLMGWYSNTYYTLTICKGEGTIKYSNGKIICVYKPNVAYKKGDLAYVKGQ